VRRCRRRGCGDGGRAHGLHQRGRTQEHQEDQDRVGVGVPRDGDADRREGERERRDRGRDGAEVPLDHAVQQGHRAGAERDHRQHQLPGAVTEDTRREPHDPQRERRLVDRDEAAGVQSAEEERLPALGAGVDGRVVEGVAADGRHVPGVQRRGQHEDRPQSGAGPARILRVTGEQSAQPAAHGGRRGPVPAVLGGRRGRWGEGRHGTYSRSPSGGCHDRRARGWVIPVASLNAG
jgi:hypothetical protein